MAYPRFQLARVHKYIKRATGSNLAVQSASTSVWYDLGAATNGPGAAGFDMTLAAQIGDVIEYRVNLMTGTEVTNLYIDIATIVSSSPVNWFGSGGGAAGVGIAGWRSDPSVLGQKGGSAWYTVQASDLASGSYGPVTFRPMYRMSIAATVKTMYASTDIPMFLSVQNIGPVDPH